MRALIVFHSRSGMTEMVARAIMVGLEASGVESHLKRADAVGEQDLKEADLWVFGSPVHFFGATGPIKKALKLALKNEPNGRKFATFDTRYASFNGLGAAGKMANILKGAGGQMIIEPGQFIVKSGKGPLAKGEETRASELGKRIAEAAMA